jgi:hypothetical protein
MTISEQRSTKKLTTDEFIKRAKEIHGDEYDYSNAEYVNNKTPVKIICSKHGEFEQIPKTHLLGRGCSKCKGGIKSNTEDFLIKAENLYGDKYDYSEVNYVNNRIPVKIKCPIHGWFEQSPMRFLQGHTCKKCGFEKRADSHRYDTEKFIELSKQVHGDKYDYSESEYNGSRVPVKIICSKHGAFYSVAHNHLVGAGCPICRESKGEIIVANILTKNKIEFDRIHTFDDCTNELKGRYCRKLTFDFYLPNNNVCIEYDGEQHYKPYGTDTGKKLVKTQKNDKLKNKYCEENGIKLIRIPYTMKKEDIEPYILSELGM